MPSEDPRNLDAAQALAAASEEEALSADQRDALCVLGYSFIQHQQTDKALTLFEALRVLIPDDPHIQKTLSYVYLVAERYSDALATAESWQAPAGEDARAMHLIQSRALWGLERPDEAREQLQSYIQEQDAL